tara:strand:- start:1247 stop:1759 length:513 start_codon:yes stop_codon:yes gene_type:complete
MPKVQITDSIGLVQQTGSDVDVQNAITFSNSGHLRSPNSSPTGTATVLTNADSGKIIFMDASSANTVTLPAISSVTAGWHIKVVLTATGAAGIVQTGNSLEDTLAGNITAFDVDGDAVAVTADADSNTVTFVNGCLAGAWVHIYSNGTLFYVDGFGTHGTASNKITLTDE